MSTNEEKFDKLFAYIDDFRANYVRAPTFVITVISTVIAIAALAGWIFTIIFSNIDKNEQSILDLAKNQVRIEERLNSVENNQNKTIAKLIESNKK